ncbi:MAG: hypothetical protein JNM28_09460 [Armatimonadetes bacterium]|nr:hypothetical protein [Armatimonadota bacterium]
MEFAIFNISDHDIVLDPPAGVWNWLDRNIETLGEAPIPESVSWGQPFGSALGRFNRSFSYDPEPVLIPPDYALEVQIRYKECRAEEASEDGLKLPWQVPIGSNQPAYKAFFVIEGGQSEYQLAVRRDTKIQVDHFCYPLVYRYRFGE